MIEAVKKKLSEILDKRVIISEKKLSEMRISEFEDKYQIKVPKQYREFLLNYGEAYINTGYQFPMIEKSIVTPQSRIETIDFCTVLVLLKMLNNILKRMELRCYLLDKQVEILSV